MPSTETASPPTSKLHMNSKASAAEREPATNGTTATASREAELDFTLHPNWSAEKEKILLGPYDYLISYPGKDIRKQLIAAFNVWLQVPEDVLEVIGNVVGMLHTASLLVDDVEDNSILRRGVPVAHSIFGVAQTINTANYVYFQALAELAKLKNPECLTIYTEELLNLHRGQGMELFWRDNLRCPTTQDYLEMVSNKTGGLFRLAIKLMQACSPTSSDYVSLVDCIGLIFQIRDDYINLKSSQYHNNKGFCEDLTEGKFSFPIIHAIHKDPSNMQLLNILKQRTESEDIKKYAVAYMDEKTGSFEYTRDVLQALHVRATELLDGHGGNHYLDRILEKLVVKKGE
ncbi:isoprenoid synthase domain-containing protein [Tricharina praecox]|uniref:isoprenoid synthase domain-containing protein n=1 Tax=Tricharina praecox TaxID=43433 RepID=UPI00222023FD|nr:isoprenoid synthase domain-containing protein [Tricharina praecox]KAI5854006.1 isoprenoid synthase domain-containing protein [Tricharina praecox]